MHARNHTWYVALDIWQFVDHLGVAAGGYERIWKDTRGYVGYVRISLVDFGYEFWDISIKDIHTIYPDISCHIHHIHTYPISLSVYLSILLSNKHIQAYILYILRYPSDLSMHISMTHIQLHIFCILCYPFCLSLHILLFIHAHIQLSYPNYISFLSGCILPIYPCISYLVIQTFIQRHI